MSYPGQVDRLTEEVIASTTTIAPVSDFVRVTGTTNIATITPSQSGIAQRLILVATDGTVNTVTSGNILVAVAMAINRTVVFVYSPTTAKWYPGAIS